jgi:hypothetical protein
MPDDPLAPGDVLHPWMPQELHDALAAVRGSGKYYGGTPVAPGPPGALTSTMEATVPAIGRRSLQDIMHAVDDEIHGSGIGPLRPIEGTNVRAGTGPKNLRPESANENIARGYGPRTDVRERAGVLNKLIVNRDFRPSLEGGRVRFRSLTPRENEIMNSIGWARAPDVSYEDEISEDPLTSLRAWERNIRHWLELASPK